MKLIITKQHIKGQLRKFGFDEVEDGAYELINDYHMKFVRHIASKRNFKKQYSKLQNGGRVAFPLEYFGGNTSSYMDSPKFTDVSATEAFIRPSILLNDPSGGLATPKAMEPLIGGASPCFKLTKTACKEALLQANIDDQGLDKKRFTNDVQQKFETLFTKAVNKVKKTSKTSVFKESDLKSVLNLQTYKSFKH
jgi:hypothetical protein